MLASSLPAISIVLFLALLMALEEWARRGDRADPDLPRAATNWGLGAVNFALAALVPVGALAAAAAAERGPLSGWSTAAAFLPLLMARSFAAYWLHRLFHAAPWLWRIHRVHHADTAIDTSTGLRNHPVEALAATGLAAGLSYVLAPPLLAVALVDAVLFGAALWQHAAIRLPERLSLTLEAALVTPRSHLRHHARERRDHDANYGDLLTLWDRLFGTWRQPDQAPLSIGLSGQSKPQSLPGQLLAPFRG